MSFQVLYSHTGCSGCYWAESDEKKGDLSEEGGQGNTGSSQAVCGVSRELLYRTRIIRRFLLDWLRVAFC